MEIHVVITELKDRTAAAVFENDRLTELYFPDSEHKYRIGNIYLGRIKKIVKPLRAAFVDISPGVTGFLPLRDSEFASLRPETVIPVQILKDPVKSKDMVLTREFSLSGKYLVLTRGKRGVGVSRKIQDLNLRETLKSRAEEWLREAFGNTDEPGFGLLIRTNASDALPEDIYQEFRELRSGYEEILRREKTGTDWSGIYIRPREYLTAIRDLPAAPGRIVTDLPEYHEEIRTFFAEDPGILQSLAFYRDEMIPLRKVYRLEAELERARNRVVWLPSGGSLVLEVTEALTVIDVNTGKGSEKKGRSDMILKTNLEAAEEAARQIRLRNYGGIILIDFINMRSGEDRSRLGAALADFLRRDPVKAEFLGFTRLELAEIVREKRRRPLHEELASFGI